MLCLCSTSFGWETHYCEMTHSSIFGNWDIQCAFSNQNFTTHRVIFTHGTSADVYNEGNLVETLLFDNCSMKVLPGTLIKSFPNLRKLALTQTSLEVLKAGFFYGMASKFSHLKVSNQLRTIERYALSGLINLKFAIFSDNQIETLPYQIFANNLMLRYVDFKRNKITAINMKIFAYLPKTKSLAIDLKENECANLITFGDKLEVLDDCFKNCIDKICEDFNGKSKASKNLMTIYFCIFLSIIIILN